MTVNDVNMAFLSEVIGMSLSELKELHANLLKTNPELDTPESRKEITDGEAQRQMMWLRLNRKRFEEAIARFLAHTQMVEILLVAIGKPMPPPEPVVEPLSDETAFKHADYSSVKGIFD